MTSSNPPYDLPANKPSHAVKEEQIEYGFIGKLQGLKYEYRADIRDRAALERNFREKFEALNRVKLSDGEFARLLDEIVTSDVFTAAKTLRTINSFTREDGTPLNYTLVNIKDWCKNTFEVVNQLRINTDYSHHRYDVLILINGVPCVQIELKTLGINPPKPGEALAKRAVIEAILAKHDTATASRRFNAVLATASINDAIEYHTLFQSQQEAKQKTDPSFVPLNIACVFSPPADGDADVKQLQQDLPTERANNQEDPEGKKAALKAILTSYNQRYGTNHSINEFDLYYQDVQKRIKDQQWPNADYPAAKKIDITIVVDMLLTGFDSKYLNTLYVDKNLKYHGLIQAFSRTNRVLNGTKPYGNILDFRQQQANVDAAIALFSGEKSGEEARTIWLVDKAPVVIQKLDAAVTVLADFMQSQGLACTPDAVHSLKGDDARAAFIKNFKEVQRLKTQLDQYTDLTENNATAIEHILPAEELQGFRGAYLETAQYFKRYQAQQDKDGDTRGDDAADVNQLDFEFVLFASAVIDYDYIMGLMSRYSQGTGKQKMTKDGHDRD